MFHFLTVKIRVGALEAEKAHPFKMSEASSDSMNNQVTASAMLIENLREDIARLTAENQRLLGLFTKCHFYTLLENNMIYEK